MADTNMNAHTNLPNHVVRRNLTLIEGVMRYLLAEPHVFESLPDNFELVILPDDDPEMRLYSLDLLDRYGAEGKPVVFVRMASSETTDAEKLPPNIYVPLAAA